MMNDILSYLYWDPKREMFDFPLPFLDRPILWYGFFFALGFFVAYWILLYLLKGYLKNQKKLASSICERMTLTVILGALIGARLGDLIFYQDLSVYLHDPLGVIKVWQGGLASHGGVAGSLIALYFLSRKFKKEKLPFSWKKLLDFSVIPAALAAVFIRVGNFFNQEILGVASTLPWAVIFGHPADGVPVIPRHPVQLYEATFYLLVFLFLFFYIRRHPSFQVPGWISGLFFLLVFTFRFFVEFFKLEQSVLLGPTSHLQMGQYLSIPFILLGAFLLFSSKRVRSE